jgi:hypothetical protein
MLRRSDRGLCVLLLFVVAGQSTAETEKKATKRTEFGTGVQAGFSLAKYHDTCIMYRIFFISGEFFAGLHKVKTQSGSESKKQEETRQSFPERLTIDVEATAYPCSTTIGHPSPPDFGSGLLSSLSFELGWKPRPERQPIKVISTQVRHPNHGVRWDYFLEISAKDVSLTQELVVDVSMRNSNNHVSLSAQLDQSSPTK